jgi:hypothetical protein
MEKVSKIQQKLYQAVQVFDGKALDQYGEKFEGKEGQVLSSFKTTLGQNAAGEPIAIMRKDENGNEIYAKYWDGKKMSLIDRSSGTAVNITYENGEPVFTTTDEKITEQNAQQMLDANGDVYFAKIQTKEYPSTARDAGGNLEKAEKDPQSYVKDIFGNEWGWNPATKRFSTLGPANEMKDAYGEITAASAVADIRNNKGNIVGRRSMTADEDRALNVSLSKVIQPTLQGVTNSANTISGMNKSDNANYKFNPTSQTMMSAPLKPKPAPAPVIQNYNNILSPTGMFGQNIDPGIGKLQNYLNTNMNAGWGDAAKWYESQYGKISTGSAADRVLWDKFRPGEWKDKW